jgi:hypothetical protein
MHAIGMGNVHDVLRVRNNVTSLNITQIWDGNFGVSFIFGTTFQQYFRVFPPYKWMA